MDFETLDKGLNMARGQSGCLLSVERDYGLSGTLITKNYNFSDSVVQIYNSEIQ